MTAQTLAQMHQSPRAAALPGTWKLAPGRAITLQPASSGVLRVAHGSLWVTFDGPHRGPLNDLGDHVVEVGESVRLQGRRTAGDGGLGPRRSRLFQLGPRSPSPCAAAP
jgi:hypothetical protein